MNNINKPYKGNEIKIYSTFRDNIGKPISELQAYEDIRKGNLSAKDLKTSKEVEYWTKEENDNKKREAKNKLSVYLFSYNGLKADTSFNKANLTGLVHIDIDQDNTEKQAISTKRINTKQDFLDFKEKARLGGVPIVRACAYSSSGHITGRLWANFMTDIKDHTFKQETYPRLFQLANLSDTSIEKEIYQKIYKLYADYIQHILREQYGIFVKEVRGSKQVRFVMKDEGIVVNLQSESILLNDVIDYLEEKETQNKAHKLKSNNRKSLSNVVSGDVLQQGLKASDVLLPITDVNRIHKNLVSWINNKDGIFYAKGSRFTFISALGFAMSRYGIPLDVAISICTSNYSMEEEWNSSKIEYHIRGIYSKHPESFGMSAFEDKELEKEVFEALNLYGKEKAIQVVEKGGLKCAAKTIEIIQKAMCVSGTEYNIEEGEYLGKYADVIDKELQENPFIELIVGTGSGKSFLVNDKSTDGLYKAFSERKGEHSKLIIINSLNAKARLDAAQYNNVNVTGETLKEAKRDNRTAQFWTDVTSNNTNIILTNQHQINKLLEMLKQANNGVYPPILMVVDEVQTLAKEYRSEQASKIIDIIENKNENFEVILQTGTPKDYWSQLGFKRIKFTRKRGRIDVKVRKKFSDIEHNLISLLAEAEPKNALILAKINNKSLIEDAKTFLIKGGYIKAEDVIVIHSDLTKSERDIYEPQLQAPDKYNGSSFADNVKLVLCTSAINEGVDIKMDREVMAANFERNQLFEPDSLVQFLDRVRVSHDVNKQAYFFTPKIEDAIKGYNSFSPKFELKIGLDVMQNFADTLTQQKRTQSSNNAQIKFAMDSLSNANLLYFDTDSDTYKVDFIGLVNYIENKHNNLCTNLEGFRFIEAKFPYIKFDRSEFIGDEEAINETDKKLVTDSKQEKRLEADKLQDRTYHFILENGFTQFVLCWFVARNNGDFYLSKEVLGRIPTSREKVQAKEFVENNPEIFRKRNYDQSIKIVKAIHLLNRKCSLNELEALNIVFKPQENEDKDNYGMFLFSANKGKKFHRSFSLLAYKYMVQKGYDIDVLENADKSRFIDVVAKVVEHSKSGNYSLTDLAKYAESLGGLREIDKTVSPKGLSELIKHLYKVRFSNKTIEGKKRSCVVVEEEYTLNNFIASNEVDASCVAALDEECVRDEFIEESGEWLKCVNY